MSVLLFGVEAFAAATLIPFATRAWAACLGNASRRHLMRLSGMAALLLLPLFAMLFPSEFVLQPASPSMAVAASTTPYSSAHFVGWLLTGIVVLWSAGVLVLLARALRGALALTALFRRSDAHPFETSRIAAWSTRAGHNGGWRLRLSAEIQTPISWGIIRPVVLLPRQCADWDTSRLDAAMLHELAHLRRRDCFSQALTMLCCALYWLHPLVRAEARALKADAEEAADDAVIVAGVKQSDYADLLLRVAVNGPHAFAGLECAMARRSGLEARIQSILAQNPTRSGATKMQILKTALLGTATALVLALVRPSFGADRQTSPLPPVAPVPAIAATPAIGATMPVPVVQSELSTPVRASGASASVKPAPAARRAPRIRRPDIQWPVDAHIGDTVAKAINQAHIDETVAKAIADAHINEKVTAALADAHIDEKIAAAMKAAQPEIDAAIARAQRAAEAAQQATPQ